MPTEHPGEALPSWYIPDPEGEDLRPDPDAATTVADLVWTMRAYRVWAGNASLQTLAVRCRHQVSKSTFQRVLAGEALPTLLVLQSFMDACGATPGYRERFERAWRRLDAERARPAASGRAPYLSVLSAQATEGPSAFQPARAAGTPQSPWPPSNDRD
jgi:hypothetical protein